MHISSSLLLQMKSFFIVLLCLVSAARVQSENVVKNETIIKGTVFVNGVSVIGHIDDDFICATLDWWPPEKCDYGTCSWDYASLLNLDLSNKILINAIKAFSPLKIRMGGTLQDKVIYEDKKQPCHPFSKNESELFGFSQGCLPMKRWDELNYFFEKTGAKVTFGLNALGGRTIKPGGTSEGAWDYTNAESLIRYTVQKNYTIHGWELGNELCGTGVGTRIAAEQYATDTIALRRIVNDAYKNCTPKPLVISPGGFFEANWFREFFYKVNNSVDVITHHIYNLGPGVDAHLVEKILNPSVLDGEANNFRSLHSVLHRSPTSAKSWVGEAGGAYNSGHDRVSNAFVYSFWYLDQLGMASSFDTRTYCRQSLVGGNYGLLNTTTFVPNPDYYSALLWHQLMGKNVLSANFLDTQNIRAYAHCAKKSNGITLLLLNLDNSTTAQIRVSINITNSLHRKRISHKSKTKHWVPHGLKTVHSREEYHLTAKDGDLQSQIVLLNGKILTVSSSGDIPPLEPLQVDASNPLTVAPLSIAFFHMPYVAVPACS